MDDKPFHESRFAGRRRACHTDETDRWFLAADGICQLSHFLFLQCFRCSHQVVNPSGVNGPVQFFQVMAANEFTPVLRLQKDPGIEGIVFSGSQLCFSRSRQLQEETRRIGMKSKGMNKSHIRQHGAE